jgi:alcohol dehydrogenase (NADP+)
MSLYAPSRAHFDAYILQPLVPGHEIVGKVVRVGPKVTSLKVGDRAGVG